MQKNFLIIGITGALGSGCSEVAEFIERRLFLYKKDVNAELKKIEVSIRKHFEFIKSKKKDFDVDNDEDDSPYCGDDIESLFLKKRNSEKYQSNELQLKIVNRNLRELLIRRKVLNYFYGQEWAGFYKISMADILVKLMLQHAFGKNFLSFCSNNKIPEGIKKILELNAKKHAEYIIKFDMACKKKDWRKYDYPKYDELLVALGEIRKKLFANYKECNKLFQDVGDNVRLSENPYNENKKSKKNVIYTLAREVNNVIKYIRNKKVDSKNHFIINSFRNPAEVQFFRQRYGSFYLCSLYASKEHRQKRLEELGAQLDEVCDERDAGKGKKPNELNKQDVPRCTLLSDYAITTEKKKEHYQYEIIRFLSLIDSPGLVQPRNDEEVMNLAYSLSLRSTCLSRQVGAVITNPEGFIIAAGWNAVGSGQLGCSLVSIEDYKKFSDDGYSLANWREHISNFTKAGLFDELNLKESDYFCFKDMESAFFLRNKIGNACGENSSERDKIIKNIKVKRLEYARALHAEENAILQAARFGGTGIAGGTIYTTTYPCELCSKKIYQAQLSRIVYTEPYPGSLSETIFLKDGVRQISIEQFEGVKSPSFFRLFKPAFDLKEQQTIDDCNEEESS